jgi:amidohydrolase
MPKESIESRIQRLKDTVIASVDSQREKLTEISMEIHDNPELCFKEFRASKLLTDYLKKNGFTINYPAYGLDSAFEAIIGNAGPKIAILAEYDAVADLGHACGHNIIGSAAVGAGVALTSVINELGGRVVVLGTPAEEGGNGKGIMIKRGAFKDIDAAMMIHPNTGQDKACSDSVAFILLKIEYLGKAAHPAQPEKGINAQDAMLIAFTAFNTLRIATPYPAIDGSITQGGVEQHTVIPDHTAANCHIRATDDEDLRNRLEKVLNCFKAGALATGASLKHHYDWDNRYRAQRSNRVMAELFDSNMKIVRQSWDPVPQLPGQLMGGTDMGNVSTVTPAIQPLVSIAPADVTLHTPAATKATASEIGHQAMVDSAKAMAMTTIDLLVRPELLRKARAEWKTIPK